MNLLGSSSLRFALRIADVNQSLTQQLIPMEIVSAVTFKALYVPIELIVREYVDISFFSLFFTSNYFLWLIIYSIIDATSREMINCC